MSSLDIVLAIPLLWGLIRGFMRGFIIEIASLFALVLGVYGAIHFSFYMESLLVEHTEMAGSTLSVSSFALTFIAIVIGIHLGAKLLQKIISMAALGIVNRIAGAVFGLLKWLLIASYTLSFVNGFGGLGLLNDASKKDSVLYPLIVQAGPMIIPALTEANWFESVEELIPEELPELP